MCLKWIKQKNLLCCLIMTKKHGRTIEKRNAPTTVHRVSLSFQSCYDAIIKKNPAFTGQAFDEKSNIIINHEGFIRGWIFDGCS